MSLVERISKKIGEMLSDRLNLNEDNKEIVTYGAFNILQTIFALLWVIIFGIIFGVLVQALIITFTISIFRKYSGGVHASTPVRCVIVGTIVAVGFGILVNKFLIDIDKSILVVIGILILIFSYFITYKFAPVDSKAKVISDGEMRKKLKKSSLIVITIFALISLFLIFVFYKYNNENILNIIECIYIGLTWQVFTLTSLAHSVVNKINHNASL